MTKLFPATSGRFVVTPGGVTALPPAPLKRPHWAEGLPERFFVSVGVFSDNKNQPRLLEAWRQLQTADAAAPGLALLGTGDAAFLESVIAPAVARLPRPEHVRLPGRVPDAELAWAYRHALGCIQPSFAEGFGLPLVEAMAAGCAVICSRSTSLPETVGDAALLFDPTRPEEMVDAVRRFGRDQSLRRELIARGRRRSGAFTWQANAEGVAAEMAALLGTRSPRVVSESVQCGQNPR